MSLKKYKANNVFPLKQVYKFAKKIGGEVAVKTKAIKRRGQSKITLLMKNMVRPHRQDVL
jgi:hypothetical protein